MTVIGLALAGVAGWAGPAAARCSDVDPIALYGPEARYEVRRNGSPIGSHRLTFRRHDGVLVINAQFSISITFLGFPVYRYDYRSEEIWKDGCMRSVEAWIDDDGKRWTVTGREKGDELRVSGPSGNFVIERPVFPTNHWNAEVVRTNAVFNTLTGRLNEVNIKRVGDETVPTGTGPRKATHYRFTGELETNVWYDAAGRWVKMRFQGKDGSPIEYICQRCGPPPSSERDG